MLRLMVIAITLSLALTTPTHAQISEKVSNLADFLNRTGSELAQTKTNLLQMSKGMQPPEGDWTMLIHDEITRVETYVDRLNIVASIYTLMIDIRDRAAVKKYLVILAKQAVSESNYQIEKINEKVVLIHSPAAIAEAQKARDLIQKIRDEIQRTFPDS